MDAAAFGGSHADRHSDWYQRGLVRGSPQRKTFGPGHQRTGDDGNICVHSIYGVPTVVHFSFKLKLLPTGGAYTPPKGTGWSYYGDVAKHLILPAIALSITNLANAVLYTRNSMIDVLHEDYIRTAYAKGNNKGRVLRVHALKNALIPTVTVIGMQIGFMVGGATVTETVFSWPGIGRMVYDAVNALDYPVLQGAFLVMAVAW